MVRRPVVRKVSVAGIGKLGCCFAACAASRGFETLGVDINDYVVNSINDGISPIVEPGLQELITKVGKKLSATKNHKEAIEKTDITFIMVATPSDPDGNFSNEYVEKALIFLAKSLRKSKKKYHLFVISSTLMPTSMRERIIPLIVENSGRKLGEDFGICYNPDLVALGSVINDFLNPDMVIIGESDKYAGDILTEYYTKFCKNNPPICRMPIIDAELAKMSLNAYITMKITFANSLANICEKIPGANVDNVTKTIGRDKRIAPYYLRGGLSFGGMCFPRDTRAFNAFGNKIGYDTKLIKAVDEVNAYQDRHLADLVLKQVTERKEKKVSILGLAFKPDTPVIVESPAIKLIDNLLEHKIKIVVYDPLAVENARASYGENIIYASSVKECVAQSEVCAITTASKEFMSIDESYIVHNPTTIIDCWRIIDPSKLGGKVKYTAVGTVC